MLESHVKKIADQVREFLAESGDKIAFLDLTGCLLTELEKVRLSPYLSSFSDGSSLSTNEHNVRLLAQAGLSSPDVQWSICCAEFEGEYHLCIAHRDVKIEVWCEESTTIPECSLMEFVLSHFGRCLLQDKSFKGAVA